MSIIKDMAELSDEEYLIMKEILNLFIYSKNKLNIYQIQELLKNKSITVNINTLYKLLSYLQVREGKIVKDDFIGGVELYSLLPEIYYRSKYSENYESFKTDNTLDKLLLVSDTHIGNDFMYNEELINKVYDYAYKDGIRTALHLGDLFEGTKSKPNSEEIQLKLFRDTYPSNIKTYGIKGNHDMGIEDYLKFFGLDLRSLTILNNNYYMFPIRNEYYKCSTECLYLNDFKIKMTHEAYANDFCYNSFQELNVDSILEYDMITNRLSNKYNLLLCGHRHKALATNIKKEDSDMNNLYLSVPATSNYNLNNCVALILYFNYEDGKVSSIDVNSLYYDYNGNLYLKDSFNFDYNKEYKVFKKIL